MKSLNTVPEIQVERVLEVGGMLVYHDWMTFLTAGLVAMESSRDFT